MALVTSAQMLRDAKQGGYAVGAFNVENMEMIQAAVQTAEELRAPIILQTTPSTVKYSSLDAFFAMVKPLAERASVPVALHLDHAKEVSLVAQAILSGYTSVMIDASEKPLAENVEAAKKVLLFAEPNGIPVEAELGRISGKEDSLSSSDEAYTDPEEAVRFVEQTGISSLAVAIGTAHGIYHSAPKLNKKLLAELSARLPLPLVLHGASGLSDQDISDCVKLGICKVNFATDLRVRFTGAVRDALGQDPSIIDPKTLGKAGMAAVKKEIAHKMSVCGCVNRV